MQTEFYTDKIGDQDYERTVYNAIINSRLPETNNKNRKFTTLDMFPTIIASLGIEIEGDRLGLGTNLYSGKPTLTEELSYEYLNSELKKTSLYYNEHILGEDYYVFIKTKRQNEKNIINNQ